MIGLPCAAVLAGSKVLSGVAIASACVVHKVAPPVVPLVPFVDSSFTVCQCITIPLSIATTACSLNHHTTRYMSIADSLRPYRYATRAI